MKCKTCGKNAESEYCFKCKPRKALKSVKFSTVKRKTSDDSAQILQMQEFFLSIWKKKPHLSEISGIPLIGEPSSAYFHHILPKSKYPEAKFDEDNIILLTFDEHNNVENDIYKYEIINKKREQLKIKYALY
jgi:hypothetical protein